MAPIADESHVAQQPVANRGARGSRAGFHGCMQRERAAHANQTTPITKLLDMPPDRDVPGSLLRAQHLFPLQLTAVAAERRRSQSVD